MPFPTNTQKTFLVSTEQEQGGQTCPKTRDQGLRDSGFTGFRECRPQSTLLSLEAQGTKKLGT